jgi:hypothetical protein
VNQDPGEAARRPLSLTDADEQELARKSAAVMASDGRTSAWLRAQSAREGDVAFLAKVAAELEFIEARQCLRALPGGASRHPLAVRLAASKHAEAAPALALVPPAMYPDAHPGAARKGTRP